MAEHDITRILRQWGGGDQKAAEQLFPLVYDELRRLARSYLSKERSGHTLQPTALVHEAYLRLIDQDHADWQNRVHFYAIAATMMRRILVNHARDRAAMKRGRGFQVVSLEDTGDVGHGEELDLVRLDEALERLEKVDERKMRVVEMRFFGGMTEKEISSLLDVSEKTVRRDWTMAKLWLRRELTGAAT